MKKGLVFISALLVLSLVFNIFQYTNDKNYTECGKNFELYSNDSIFIDRTLEVYDAFVKSKMGDELPIGEAYSRFFAETGQEMENAGDMTLFMPDSSFVYQWTYDLISNRMQNLLIEPYYWNSAVVIGLPGSPQLPDSWQYEPITPKFVEFGRHLGKTNNFWTDFADDVEAAGGISPTCYAAIVRMNDNINFDNKHERFLAVIGFMNGCLDHRDFNLVKDVRRNDSLKIAWEIEMERRRIEYDNDND